VQKLERTIITLKTALNASAAAAEDEPVYEVN
jgi:hypothetical protein